jgi:hypothetical protein
MRRGADFIYWCGEQAGLKLGAANADLSHSGPVRRPECTLLAPFSPPHVTI